MNGLILMLLFSTINPQITVDTICKVQPSPNVSLSGIVFAQTDTEIKIVSAGHFASFLNADTYVTFFNAGYDSLPTVGKISKLSQPGGLTTDDYSIIIVQKKDLGSYPSPAVVKFAEQAPKLEERLFSIGCTEGGWPIVKFGYTRRVEREDAVWFLPSSESGQSGGGVFNFNNECVGMILWSSGVCVSSQKLRRLINE